MQIDILVNTLRSGYAVSQHTFDLARALWRDHSVRLLSQDPPRDLPPDIAPLAHQACPADFDHPADLTILQYPLWYPLAERFRGLPGRRLFYYHGVTDPGLLESDSASADDRVVLRNSLARTELCHHADRVVCTSPFTAQELQTHSDYPVKQVDILPPAVAIENFQPDAAPGRPPQTLLFAGRIAPNKRLDLLLDAFAKLASVHPDLQLLIVGAYDISPATRALYDKLSQQVRRLGLADRVRFTGRVDSVLPSFAQADIYVQPSDHEGFGVPLVEAMAAGLPVVASASGAMPWVLRAEPQDDPAESAGLLFAPGNSDSLCHQIERLLADAELRSSLCEVGFQRARDFSLARFAPQIRHLVAETFASKQAVSPASSELFALADVAYRDYRVRSGLPIVGPLIAWLRRQSTTHVREAYLDRIVEQQVNYNRRLAREIEELRAEVERLKRQLAK